MNGCGLCEFLAYVCVVAFSLGVSLLLWCLFARVAIAVKEHYGLGEPEPNVKAWGAWPAFKMPVSKKEWKR
jgi:hypothetical protein